jgi:uncharacterized protein YigE (DUF2233 family)
MAKLLKLFFLVLIVLGSIRYLYLARLSPKSSDRDALPVAVPTASPVVLPRIREPDKFQKIGAFAYLTFRATGSQSLNLIPNFADRQTSRQLADRYGCLAFANGAFYDTSNRPLGLFEVKGVTVRKKAVNNLIDAVFWQDQNRRFHLGFSDPIDPLWAIQTGPMLFSDDKPLAITIRNDEKARRNGVILTNSGDPVFFTIFDPESLYLGPLLSEMPAYVSRLASQENLEIKTATNLDGGSASAFWDGKTRLEELTAVGSLFCLK